MTSDDLVQAFLFDEGIQTLYNEMIRTNSEVRYKIGHVATAQQSLEEAIKEKEDAEKKAREVKKKLSERLMELANKK